MRTKSQRDKNEAEMVKQLRALGYFVTHLNDPGVPDLLVIEPHKVNLSVIGVATNPDEAVRIAENGFITLIEVKAVGAALRPLQLEWHNKALGHGT